mmetsp:Transcript_48596/g.105886  ORF Transcript_48596/g.105886 Transcript_48596/m.105886 type:complete len:150 (+) Transcript_48596:67-516(+)
MGSHPFNLRQSTDSVSFGKKSQDSDDLRKLNFRWQHEARMDPDPDSLRSSHQGHNQLQLQLLRESKASRGSLSQLHAQSNSYNSNSVFKADEKSLYYSANTESLEKFLDTKHLNDFEQAIQDRDIQTPRDQSNEAQSIQTLNQEREERE